jgi:ubiquinone/menaquinone biosynthesis C-methylase UbiE
MKMGFVEKFFVNSLRREARIEALTRDLLGSVELDGATALLDVGCGSGAAARCAAARCVAGERQLNVVGVDVDPAQVALARERAGDDPRLTFREANATQLPFEDSQFDVVVSFMATHHIADWQSALSEMRRVLRPGGHLLYADMFLRGPVAFVSNLAGHRYALPSLDEMIASIERSGFSRVTGGRSGPSFFAQYRGTFRRT